MVPLRGWAGQGGELEKVYCAGKKEKGQTRGGKFLVRGGRAVLGGRGSRETCASLVGFGDVEGPF